MKNEKEKLEALEKEWDRLDSMGGQEERQQQIADQMKAIQESIPKFEHDCEDCQFLGRFNGFDLYCCKGQSRYTLIARDGDEPSQYKSGARFKDVDPEIGEAHRRAVEVGLLDGTTKLGFLE